MLEDIEALEERLSRPTAAVVEDLARGSGDLLVLGAGGKMGPTLCRMARRALDQAGSTDDVIAVARWTDTEARARLQAAGITTGATDLLEPGALRRLPDAGRVVFLAGTKFGSARDPAATWAVNAFLPGRVAERYAGVPTVVLSSGNVYPLMPVTGPGADERTEPRPAGEYAWSVLARERVVTHVARRARTPVVLIRLNYATELRYGVLVDVARRVWGGEPIELHTGHANVLWQGDANGQILRALGLGATPPTILNLTGSEVVSIRELAERFGTLFDRPPVLDGTPAATALLSDAGFARALFGPPEVDLETQIAWVADWIRNGRPLLDKPTHYEVRDGVY